MKRLKKLTILLLSAMIAIAIAGCNSNASSEKSGEDGEKIKLKVATYVPPTSPVYKYLAEPWMEKVTEMTDGKVEFDTYPGEQLGKAHDMLQLTKDNVTDIGIFPANYFPDNMPLSNLLAGLPNLSKTSSQGTLAYNDLILENEQLLEIDYLRNGIRPIMTHVSPPYEIWTTKKKITKPEDLKGFKMRTPGGIANEVYESLGAVPVSVSHTETYEALEKGVIEGASYSSVAVEGSGTQELLNYALFIHLGTAIHGIVINENVWQKLPEDVQNAMMEAGQEIVKTSGEKYDADTEAFNAEFAKNAEVTEITGPEHDKWVQLFDDFIENWIKKHESDGYPYEEIVNAYKEKLKQYE